MTGPEHFQKAEELLRKAETWRDERSATHLAYAQVHATLSIAAAIQDRATAEDFARIIDNLTEEDR